MNVLDQIKQIGSNIDPVLLANIIAGLAPGAADSGINIAAKLAPVAAELLANEQTRHGDTRSTEQVLDSIGQKGEANEVMFLEDLARLHAQMAASGEADTDTA